MSHRLVLVSLCAAVFIFGCRLSVNARDAGLDNSDGDSAHDSGLQVGDGGNGAGSTDGGVTDIDRWCADFSDAACGFRQRCGWLQASERALCRARLGADCLRTTKAAVAAGVLDFVASQASVCLASFAAASCARGESPALAPACALHGSTPALTVPRARLGQPCGPLAPCLEGYCPNFNIEACQVCQAYRPIDGPCNGTTDLCEPSIARCTSRPDGGTACTALAVNGTPCTTGSECQSGQCVADGVGGNVCGRVSQGSACTTTFVCAAGDFCLGVHLDAGVLVAGSCAAKVDAGAPCPDPTSGEGCNGSLLCVDGTCREFSAYTRAVGARCTVPRQCIAGAYCQGLFASADGTGTCTNTLPTGTLCEIGVEEPCQSPARCVARGAESRCLVPLQRGAKCEGPTECADELVCALTSDGGTCVPAAGLGESCAVHRTCAEGSCEADAGLRCVALAAGGEPCRSDVRCASRVCNFVRGKYTTCRPQCP